MRFPFPLFVKKRGQRSTASDQVGRWGEVLFYLAFALSGGLALWAHTAWVLIPDWQLSNELRDYVPSVCRLLEKRIAFKESLRGSEYRAELKVALELDKTPIVRWVHAASGEYSPSETDAQHALDQFEVERLYPCWFDPDDPTQIVLRRHWRWWPWLVVLIPFSLFLFGVVGLIRTFLLWDISYERRALAAQSAPGLEFISSDLATPLQWPTLPSVDRVIDSPGVRLAYRLSIDGSSNWRLAGMIAVCLCWNGLVALFVVNVLAQFWRGNPNWIIAGLILPFVATGIWLAVILVRDAWMITGVGITHVEIAHHPLYPGQECNVHLLQAGQMHVLKLSVNLICEEHALFQEGTDTRESVETVYRDNLFQKRRFDIVPGVPCEADFVLSIPASAMHSFQSGHNSVRWLLEVRGAPRRWPPFHRRFPIYVYPHGVTPAPLFDESIEIPIQEATT